MLKNKRKPTHIKRKKQRGPETETEGRETVWDWYEILIIDVKYFKALSVWTVAHRCTEMPFDILAQMGKKAYLCLPSLPRRFSRCNANEISSYSPPVIVHFQTKTQG